MPSGPAERNYFPFFTTYGYLNVRYRGYRGCVLKLKWALIVIVIAAALLVSGCCCCCIPGRGYYRVPYTAYSPGHVMVVQGPTVTVVPPQAPLK
jgi:hypothetical protein